MNELFIPPIISDKTNWILGSKTRVEEKRRLKQALNQYYKQHYLRKGKYSSKFKRIAKQIKNDKKYCEICSGIEGLMVHHKDIDRNNNELSNLILLCFNCHKQFHKHLRLPNWIK
jgi:5-methylcytosine-specific restriction endonuclease McrA